MPSLSEPQQQVNIRLPLPNKNWQPDLFSTDLGRTQLILSVTANVPELDIFWRFNLTGSRQDLLKRAKFTAFQRLSAIETMQKEPVRFEQAKTTLAVTNCLGSGSALLR
jgi:hypothetical protein